MVPARTRESRRAAVGDACRDEPGKGSRVKPVVQEDPTGCAIACAAALSGTTYKKAKRVANALGIHVDDSALWSETRPMIRLLTRLGFRVNCSESPFTDWDSLPDLALLAIKWHLERGRPHWHWVVFVRETEGCYVLDPKKGLASNVRTDFGRMKPKWYLQVRTDPML